MSTLLIVFYSCKNDVVTEPHNLIDDDMMIEIIYDLALIDGGRNSSYNNGVSPFIANDFIFKKYKIDSLQFANSNKYYAADVAKYKRMYKIVRDKLSDKKAELEVVNNLKSVK